MSPANLPIISSSFASHYISNQQVRSQHRSLWFTTWCRIPISKTPASHYILFSINKPLLKLVCQYALDRSSFIFPDQPATRDLVKSHPCTPRLHLGWITCLLQIFVVLKMCMLAPINLINENGNFLEPFFEHVGIVGKASINWPYFAAFEKLMVKYHNELQSSGEWAPTMF